METYFIKTFGCQMNVADSEMMAGLLEARGLRNSPSPSDADLIVVNTCTIRRKAEDKAYSELGRLVRLKKRRNGFPVIAAAGCVAKKEGQKMFKRLPQLDIVLGPSRIRCLGDLLDLRLNSGKAVIDIEDNPADPVAVSPHRRGKVKAFVNIMWGCDNKCAYCVVPSVRGPEISRPPKDIEQEVRELVDNGYKEVTLLGQNVNSYGKGLVEGINFPDLLEMLDKRTGISRIRFTTSHPKDFSRELAGAIRDLSSVCEAVHLPVQAGSDKILKAMNRGYTIAKYREKIAFLREAVPEVSMSTDVIVGYPLEKREDFEKTYRLVEETSFSSLFAFKYSPREETPAAELPDEVPPEEKDRRLQAILDIQKRTTLSLNQKKVGKIVEVLAEEPSKTNPLMMSGRTRGNKVVNFTDGIIQTGQIVPVMITEARQNCLIGVSLTH